MSESEKSMGQKMLTVKTPTTETLLRNKKKTAAIFLNSMKLKASRLAVKKNRLEFRTEMGLTLNILQADIELSDSNNLMTKKKTLQILTTKDLSAQLGCKILIEKSLTA